MKDYHQKVYTSYADYEYDITSIPSNQIYGSDWNDEIGVGYIIFIVTE